MRKHVVSACCLCFMLMILLADCSAQESQRFNLEVPFPGEATQALYKWDAVQGELILYRDVNDIGLPAVRAYDSRLKARAPIYPLKDFPGAVGLDIWSVAAASGGMTVLAAVVQYGGLNNKNLLLTYDGLGNLRKLWDVRPYHHHQVAVDREGNVYAFGHREDRGEERGEPDYPLLVKYSSNGTVSWESLPRSVLPYGLEIVVTNAETLEHSLVVANDALVLFVSTTRELLRFSLRDGSLNQRLQMSSLLDRIAAEAGRASAKIICLSVAGNGDLVLQLRLEPGNRGTSVAFVMARISRDGSSYSRLSSVASTPSMGAFLGLASDGRCLFFRSRTYEHDALIVESRELSQ